MTGKPKRIFRIYFSSEGKAYELYARRVSQGEIYGFIEVEDLLFGERSRLVVDPAEESLRKEFAGVRRLLLPYHAVSRIEEVEKEGPGKVFAIAGAQADEPGATPPPPFPPAK